MPSFFDNFLIKFENESWVCDTDCLIFVFPSRQIEHFKSWLWAPIGLKLKTLKDL